MFPTNYSHFEEDTSSTFLKLKISELIFEDSINQDMKVFLPHFDTEYTVHASLISNGTPLLDSSIIAGPSGQLNIPFMLDKWDGMPLDLELVVWKSFLGCGPHPIGRGVCGLKTATHECSLLINGIEEVRFFSNKRLLDIQEDSPVSFEFEEGSVICRTVVSFEATSNPHSNSEKSSNKSSVPTIPPSPLVPDKDEKRLARILNYAYQRNLSDEDGRVLCAHVRMLQRNPAAPFRFALGWSQVHRGGREEELLELLRGWSSFGLGDILMFLSNWRPNKGWRQVACEMMDRIDPKLLDGVIDQLVISIEYEDDAENAPKEGTPLLRALHKLWTRNLYSVFHYFWALTRNLSRFRNPAIIGHAKFRYFLDQFNADVKRSPEHADEYARAIASSDRMEELLMTFVKENSANTIKQCQQNYKDKHEGTLDTFFRTENPPFPFDLDYVIIGLKNLEKSGFPFHRFDSAKKPFHFNFLVMKRTSAQITQENLLQTNDLTTSRPTERHILIKHGDDVRKDMLVQQCVGLLDGFLQEHGFTDSLCTYGYLCTNVGTSVEDVRGFGEFIPKTKPMRKDIMDSFEKSADRTGFHTKFVNSAAAYSVITYVLGISDRHFDNILAVKDQDPNYFTGQFFHIDFGFMFGERPSFKMNDPPLGMISRVMKLLEARDLLNPLFYPTLHQFFLTFRQNADLFFGVIHPVIHLLTTSNSLLLSEPVNLSTWFMVKLSLDKHESEFRQVLTALYRENQNAVGLNETINNLRHNGKSWKPLDT
ncbi:putative Phosphatidylinositol 3-kinase, nodule [Blattamonas nauphoetae]|uniref:Phosphatidylinositol 3-kinase, nodule n=1 Tax=Blattamonas nauphoetae TaxID=2049346 RepID=A0ABQ9XC30_9EUKA|nr:putative Phosphatidylinositol 3-kinase, nodule [Blattamonas nauphoetae]